MSTDLVHWERLPPALIPDTEYDYDGVFSGSATILDDGLPYLFFTGRQDETRPCHILTGHMKHRGPFPMLNSARAA